MAIRSSLSTADLDSTLYNLSKQCGGSIVLLDRVLECPNELVHSLEALNLPSQQVAVLDDEYFGTALEQAPLLIRLEHHHPKHWEFLLLTQQLALEVALHEQQPAGCVQAWLFVDRAVSLSRLATHLKRCMDVLVTSYELELSQRQIQDRALWRYFDPRQMIWLYQLLSAEQREYVFALTQSWVSLNRQGQAHIIHTEVSQPPDLTQRLSFDARATAALERISVIHQVIKRLRQQGHVVAETQDAVIDAWLIKAAQEGLLRQEDQVQYCLAAWHWQPEHGHFESHPALRQALQAVRSQGASFQAAFQHSLIQSSYSTPNSL